MKILLVGGAHQGKRQYAESAYGVAPGDFAETLSAGAVDGLHRLVRQLMEEGEDPESAVLGALEHRGGWVVLCDEIGGGVVPVDAFDRRWREETGRLCCKLAERADIVERVSCGIPLRLKG